MERNRKCIKCNADFVLKEKAKASNICTPCKTEYQRAYARKRVAETPEGYKEKYPYKESEKTFFVFVSGEVVLIVDNVNDIILQK